MSQTTLNYSTRSRARRKPLTTGDHAFQIVPTKPNTKLLQVDIAPLFSPQNLLTDTATVDQHAGSLNTAASTSLMVIPVQLATEQKQLTLQYGLLSTESCNKVFLGRKSISFQGLKDGGVCQCDHPRVLQKFR